MSAQRSKTAILSSPRTADRRRRSRAGSIRSGLLAELYCRRTGYNNGKSYHVTDVSRGVIGMGGIVPAQVPVAGGMALAQKMRGTDRVSLAFFGDGASNEGAVHETANLAGDVGLATHSSLREQRLLHLATGGGCSEGAVDCRARRRLRAAGRGGRRQ